MDISPCGIIVSFRNNNTIKCFLVQQKFKVYFKTLFFCESLKSAILNLIHLYEDVILMDLLLILNFMRIINYLLNK